MNNPGQKKTPTNTKFQTSHKFPDQWEVWHSYDGGFSWTLVGMEPK